MVKAPRLLIGACISGLVGVQGCILDGDASLGSDGGTGSEAGNASKAGGTSSAGGKSSGGAKSGSGGKGGTSDQTVVPRAGAGDGGAAPQAVAGETGDGGEQAGGGASADCALPIEVGPCDAAISAFAFDSSSGECVPFVYGGCEGNANNFRTQTACQAACETLVCPDHLQSDTVYEVLPLNREERACVVLERPTLVSCSMLLDPSLTVPTNYGQDFCVKRDGALYYAGTTLPKADGWEDCSRGESEIVAGAPDCRDL